MLWAISQQTAAELIYRRVDASLPLLGMQSYEKESAESIKKADVSVAKNYLNEDEIKLLGLLVEQYLAFAETMDTLLRVFTALKAKVKLQVELPNLNIIVGH